MKTAELKNATSVMEEMGKRLARCRIDRGQTQADLAEQAGIGKRTLERLENGESVQWASVVRVLRVLGLSDRLDLLIPDATTQPIELLRLKGKERKRASTLSKKRRGGEWRWGDEA